MNRIVGKKYGLFELYIFVVIAISCIGCSVWLQYYAVANVLIDIFTVGGIFCYLITFQANISEKRIRIFYMLMLYLFLSLRINKGTISSIIYVTWNVIWVIILYKCKYKNRIITYISGLFLICYFYLILFQQSLEEFRRIGGGNDNSKVLNPNIASFLLILFSMFVILTNKYFFKHKLPKVFNFLLLIITAYKIVQFGARGALLVYLIVLLFHYVLPIKWKSSLKFTVTLFGLIVAMGVIIPYVYVYFFKNGYIFSIHQIGGKNFYSGREYLWGVILDRFQNFKDVLFGIGGNEIDFSFSSHNIFLDIYRNFGLIGVILFFYNYIPNIHDIYLNKGMLDFEVKVEYLYLALGLFCMGITEPFIYSHSFIIITAFIWSIPLSIDNNLRILVRRN